MEIERLVKDMMNVASARALNEEPLCGKHSVSDAIYRWRRVITAFVEFFLLQPFIVFIAIGVAFYKSRRK